MTAPDGTEAARAADVPATGAPTVRRLVGAEIGAVVDELAGLRIRVFRDWPYLYDGDAAYEARYLAGYASNPRAVVVSVRAPDGAMVGAATGMPLADHDRALAEAVADAGVDPADTFYCAESVLLTPWRGRGLGHRFFDEREDHARGLGFRRSCFCAVVRPEDHPARPEGTRSLVPFWEARGYRPLPGAVAHLAWRDLGEATETEKPLAFRIRELAP